jgi:hypothetical protein
MRAGLAENLIQRIVGDGDSGLGGDCFRRANLFLGFGGYQ